MDKPKISKITTGGLELIDSRIINLYRPHFDIRIENLTFYFEFIDDRRDRAKIEISRLRGDNIFDVRIFNFEAGGLQGFFVPNAIGEFGNARFHFSISGISHENRRYKTVVFNLFQEVLHDGN